jgi:hypothetical protein
VQTSRYENYRLTKMTPYHMKVHAKVINAAALCAELPLIVKHVPVRAYLLSLA